MPFNRDNLVPLDEGKTGKADDIQLIPKGTVVHYRGFPFELIEDTPARGGTGIARADSMLKELHRCAERNRAKLEAQVLAETGSLDSLRPQ